MKEYFKRMQEEKTPHERRQWSLRAAMAVTAVIFFGWAGSLGLRFAEPGDTASVAQSGGIDIQSQLASVVSGVFGSNQQPNTLEVVATTTSTQNVVQQ